METNYEEHNKEVIKNTEHPVIVPKAMFDRLKAEGKDEVLKYCVVSLPLKVSYSK